MSNEQQSDAYELLSAIAREVGEFRKETNERLNRLEIQMTEVKGQVADVSKRLGRVESDVRVILKSGAMALNNRSDILELEDRVAVLESK